MCIYIIYKYIQYKSVMAAIACSKYNPPRSVLGQLPGLAPIGSVFLGGGASSKEVLKTSGCFFTRPKKKTWNTCIHYFLGGEEDTANPPFGQLILVSFWTKHYQNLLLAPVTPHRRSWECWSMVNLPCAECRYFWPCDKWSIQLLTHFVHEMF